jgi:serine/threonine protein kinase/WD40 repeat protein/Leucine-rich repeat (LRR) protein
LQSELGTTVAIKTLQPHREADRATIERFEREMVALGRLDHPNIVRALDAGEEAGEHYLVMEYVDGVDLGQVINTRQRLSIADASEVIRQAALGLGYVHRNGRVHRDVKPSNLMLSGDGTVKLLDLGLARVEEYPMEGASGDTDDILGGTSVDLTRTHQVMGTPAYMPPEQVSDSHRVDHRADLYALGCTFYKLLTGHSPIASSKSISGLSQLLDQVQMSALPVRQVRQDVPQTLSDLIDRMLAKRPEDRPQSAEEIAETLRPFATGATLAPLAVASLSDQGSVSATTPTVADPSTARISEADSRSAKSQPLSPGSNKRLLAAIAASLLLLGAGAAFLWSHWMAPRGVLVVQAATPRIGALLEKGAAKLITADGDVPLVPGPVTLPPGTYDVATYGNSRLVFRPSRVEINPDQEATLTFSLTPASPPQPPRPVVPAVPTPVEPPPPPIAYDPVELIPLLDPQRDIRGDDWKIVDGSLVSRSDRPAILMIPYRPPDSYRLEFVATRLDRNEDESRYFFSLRPGLVADGKTFGFSLGSRSGITTLDGRVFTGRSNQVYQGELLPTGQPRHVAATVTSNGTRVQIKMVVGGKVITDWRGHVAQLGGQAPSYSPARDSLELFSWLQSYRVSDLRVVPLSGDGEVVKFSDPTTDPERAAAERVVWSGGVVSVIDTTGMSAREPPQAIGGFELLRTFEGHTGPVKSVALSPDGRLAASGSGWLKGDQTARIWDVETGRMLHVLDVGHNVMSVAFSPDGRGLLVGGMSNDLTLWDTVSGQQIRTYTTTKEPSRLEVKVGQVGFTPDGKRVIAAKGRMNVVYVFDTETEAMVHRLPQSSNSLRFAVTPESRRLAIGLGDGSVQLFDLASGTPVRRFEGPAFDSNRLVYCVGISPDGTLLAAGYKRHMVRIWDIASGRKRMDVMTVSPGNESVEFTPDGRHVVAAGPGGVTCLISLDSGRVVGTTEKIPGDGWSVAISRIGDTALTAGGLQYESGFRATGDYALRLWKFGEASLESETADQPSPPTIVRVDSLFEIPHEPQIVAIDLEESLWFRDDELKLFEKLPELRELNLSGTDLSAEILDGIGTFPLVTDLSLARTKIRSLPITLGARFPALKRLDLSQCNLQDLNAQSFARLDSLVELDLSATTIDERDLSAMRSLSGLTKLDLSDTAIDDAGLASLPLLPNLVDLNLAGTLVQELTTLRADRLPALADVNLLGTPVTAQSVKRLSDSFPTVEILSGYEGVDLVTLIDPERDSITGNGDRLNGTLRISKDAQLALPVYLPSEFELELIASVPPGLPWSRSPLFEFSLSDGPDVMVGYERSPQGTPMPILYGIDGQMQPNGVAGRRALAQPTDLTMRLKMRIANTDELIRIAMFSEGQEKLVWKGERSRLRPKFIGKPSDRRRPVVVQSGSSPLTIQEFVVRPIRGRIERAPTYQPSFSDPNRQRAQTLLTKGAATRVMHFTKGSWNEGLVAGATIRPFKFQVKDLTLKGSEFSDADLDTAVRFKFLESLSLDGARISEDGLASLTGIRRLEKIEIANLPTIGGRGLRVLKKLPLLREVDLKDCGKFRMGIKRENGGTLKVIGTGEDKFDRRDLEQYILPCDSIEWLDLSGAAIGDDSVDGLTTLIGLKRLDLSETQFTAEGIETLRKALPATQIVPPSEIKRVPYR